MKKESNYLKILIAAILVAGVAFLLLKAQAMGILSLEGARNYIQSYGSFAVVIFIIIFNMRTLLVFFPYSIMVILGGSLLGGWYGFLISMLCVFSSSTLAFYISRMAGKNTVERILKGKMKNLDVKIEEHGFKIILFMRISYIFPFDALSYAAGLTRVKYREFILGTVIGMIPETFSLNMLGHNINNPFSWNFVASILLVVLTIAVPTVVKKIRSKKKNRPAND